MTIGEQKLAVPREIEWRALNDFDALRAYIPGCEELEKASDTKFRATARTKIGPVSARFKGRVTISELDPPNGYTISGEGEGDVAGFAKSGATVALFDKDGGTLLTYNVDVQIGGKVAQLGQRLVNGTAKRLADELFTRFAAAEACSQNRRPGLCGEQRGAHATYDSQALLKMAFDVAVD
jgi:uncharacterized protein